MILAVPPLLAFLPTPTGPDGARAPMEWSN
jgi:hypothetical protein